MRNIYIVNGKNQMVEEFQLNSHLPLYTETLYIYINSMPIELKKIGEATSTFVYEKSDDRDYLLWEVDYVAYEVVDEEELKGLVIITETLLEDVQDIYDILYTTIKSGNTYHKF